MGLGVSRSLVGAHSIRSGCFPRARLRYRMLQKCLTSREAKKSRRMLS